MKTLLKYLVFKYKKATIISAGILVVILLALPSVYFYRKYQTAQQYMQDPTLRDKERTQELVAKVGELIDLPEEDPTIATVSDVEKLSEQPFFAKAKNGDKVLVYTQARKAILYNPELHKIMEVASINTPDDQPTAEGDSEVEQDAETTSISIHLKNGTETSGATLNYEKELTSKVPNAVVINRSNAVNTSYEKTYIVALTGKTQQAQALADALGITYSTLPKGESAPDDADFLIIVGGE